MKNLEKAEQLRAEDKVSIRSCWECNPSHEHLKHVGGLFICFECGRFYMNGGFFDNDEHCEAEFVEQEPLKTVRIKIQK